MLPVGVLFHRRCRPAPLEVVNQVEFKGFINLIGLIFVTTNCREIVDNCLKYGWVVQRGATSWKDHPALLVSFASLLTLALLAFAFEYRRGHRFADTWSHSIGEMQQLELQLQAAKATYNIYKLKPSPPPPLEEDHDHAASQIGKPQPHQQEHEFFADQDSAATDVATLRCRKRGERAGTNADQDGNASHRSSCPPSPTSRSCGSPRLSSRHSSPLLMTSSSSSSDECATDDDDVAVIGDLGERLYAHAKQRYIDATKKIDLPKIMTTAGDYVRQQQEKIKVIKDEINDLMTPLVTVYNNLSLQITEQHVEFVHCVYTTLICVATLVIPYLTVLTSTFSPLSSLVILMLSCTWLLKLISFFHTLHSLRRVILSDMKSLRDIVPFDDERASYLHYPHSLKFSHFVTFLIAPTLCFQFNYPRTSGRDWWKIGRVFVELLFSLVLLKIIFEQYLRVILENTFMNKGGVHLFERLLRLCMPTLYCWLLMFISFFHFWMILLAELTCFADKEFYRDWWNATSFGEYWRRWNIPVHNFCRRHVYHPLIKRGFSRGVSQQLVFLLSAVAHEYVIAGSLKLGWTGLVFLSFVLQTPLTILTQTKFIRTRPILGNCIFWIVFSFTGQPMGVLIFYYLWTLKAGVVSG